MLSCTADQSTFGCGMRCWPIEEGAMTMTPQSSKAGKAQPSVRATASPRLHPATPASSRKPRTRLPLVPRQPRANPASSLLPPLPLVPLSHGVLELRYLTTLLLPRAVTDRADQSQQATSIWRNPHRAFSARANLTSWHSVPFILCSSSPTTSVEHPHPDTWMAGSPASFLTSILRSKLRFGSGSGSGARSLSHPLCVSSKVSLSLSISSSPKLYRISLHWPSSPASTVIKHRP